MSRLGSILVPGLALAWLASIASIASIASAQSLRLDQYRPGPAPTDGLAVARPNDHGHLSFGARLDVDYALSPLVYQLRASDASTEIAPVVEHLLAAQLGVSFSVFERLVFFVGLPVNLVMEGRDVVGQPRADGTSLGDLGFGVRGRLFGEADDAFALALQLTGTAPTAQAARFQARFAGEGGWTLHPELLFEVRFADVVRVTGNVGAIVRDEQDLGRLRVGHELTWAGALAVAVVPSVFELTVESWGASALDARFGQAQVSPVELVGGVRVLPGDGLSIAAAAGAGVARGYGAGDFRAILTVGYATPGERPAGDRDGDGLADDVDACPDEPEDADGFQDDDGCPDADNDADGIDDTRDACPNEPEDRDGLGDEDGCPEDDFDGDGVPDETDRCPTVPGIALALRPECTGCPSCDPEPPPIAPDPTPPRRDEPPPASADGSVHFEVGSHFLRARERPALFALLAIARAGGGPLVVEGHADFRGSEPNNVALSVRRAVAVARWLALRGVDRGRLVVAGCGESYPAEPNDTRAGRRANRRAELRSGSVARSGCRHP
ncbi:MAG: OmpA family protein [Sandaracinaceae bacterium]|nr:OmpA family protein [Sandaracinaceae bacterium]